MSKAKTSSNVASAVQLPSSSNTTFGATSSAGRGVAKSDPGRELQSLRLRADDDSDYEEDEPEDDSLDIARRTHSQHLSDAFKDGFREGFDKGQIQLAQNVFNTSHCLAAKSQVPYGQYLGVVKVLQQKLSPCPNADEDEDLCKFISQTEQVFNSYPPTPSGGVGLGSSAAAAAAATTPTTPKATVTKSALLDRLNQLKSLNTVRANSSLVAFICEIETGLSHIHK